MFSLAVPGDISVHTFVDPILYPNLEVHKLREDMRSLHDRFLFQVDETSER